MTQEVREVEVAAGSGVVLAATLVVPTSVSRPPGALLLSGSGPLDRDSNSPGQRLDISSTLATALGDLGIASLRFDKRGVGSSSGDFASTGFHDEVSDAAAALWVLRSLEDVDADRLGVIGHSVGATIAARLAAGDSAVAFAVLLGCSSTSGAEVMNWQTERIAATLPGPQWFAGRSFRRKQAKQFRRLAESDGDVIRISGEDVPARWMREFRAHEPMTDLAAMSCPVLAITGGKDIQVNPADVERIAAVAGGPCTTQVPGDLTHILRSSPHPASITRYSKLLEDPVDADLVATVSRWTFNRTKHDATAVDSDDLRP